MSQSIVLYLQLHQPYRLRQYTVFDTAVNHNYFDDPDPISEHNNRHIFERVANKSYRPMTQLLATTLERNKEFKLSLSLTGTFIEQAEQWAPDIIETLQRIVATKRVEVLAETYHHSLAFFYSKPEFERQVELHRKKIKQLFGVTPKVFRNTELAYTNDLAKWAEDHGYKGVLAEGWDSVLDWRSPNYLYTPATAESIGLLLKNYRLSDDIAFRFSDAAWKEWPLTAQKFSSWLDKSNSDEPLINLFMDFETFGEHQWADTGIFSFFESFVDDWSQRSGQPFVTASDAISNTTVSDVIDVPYVTTWADAERDLSAWNGNAMQQEALRLIYELESAVLHSDDQQLINDWRNLLTSDHTYYMATKWDGDGGVHSYFSPYDSPYDAFLSYTNAVHDIRWRLIQHSRKRGI